MPPLPFPFSALFGQEEMKTALLLNAVDPSIGGVLVRGQKGTGKSTAARALAALLPEIEVVAGCPYNCPPDRPEGMHDGCREHYLSGTPLPRERRPMPVIDLPLAATEDRVVGTLHLEHALKTGERHFEPGLLAAANRGILYVDEVNLLPDHLVDLLLDAAASGTNIVDREGLHIVHPARFILVGTMNPEEGELRPQFLDRFGLSVTITGLAGLEERQAVVRRRLEYEGAPADFIARWQAADRLLARQLAEARDRLATVAVPDELLAATGRLALALGVQGHRADLAMVKAARAHAALLERPAATPADLHQVARLALPHRLVNGPLDTTESVMACIEEALGQLQAGATGTAGPAAGREVAPEADADYDLLGDSMLVPGATAAGSMLFSFLKKKLPSA